MENRTLEWRGKPLSATRVSFLSVKMFSPFFLLLPPSYFLSPLIFTLFPLPLIQLYHFTKYNDGVKTPLAITPLNYSVFSSHTISEKAHSFLTPLQPLLTYSILLSASFCMSASTPALRLPFACLTCPLPHPLSHSNSSPSFISAGSLLSLCFSSIVSYSLFFHTLYKHHFDFRVPRLFWGAFSPHN